MKFKIIKTNDKLSVYRSLAFSGFPVLGDVFRLLKWGTNTIIRQGGVRVCDVTVAKLYKGWPIIKDVNFVISTPSFVGTRRGRKVAVIYPNKNLDEYKETIPYDKLIKLVSEL